MKKLLSILFLAVTLVACGPSKTVDVITGPAGPAGPQGPAGEAGPQGPQGANGHSLVSQTVEASGCECDEAGGQRLDIYLDLDDSLSVSEGDLFQSALIACNGKNGLNGANGLDGAQGAQGVPGATGPQGPQGAQGIAGPAGAVGPQGAQGVAGPVGPAGPQGPQGATGAQGPAGSGATLQAYTLGSSCTNISGGFYAKRDDDAANIYTSSNCSSGSKVASIYSQHTANGQGSMWLSATRLAFVDSDTSSSTILRVLNFN